jgi:hypothetical protein
MITQEILRREEWFNPDKINVIGESSQNNENYERRH